MSLPVGVAVSTPMPRMRRDTFLASRRFTNSPRWVTERASLSSFVTTSVSASRQKSIAASRAFRSPAELVCSVNSFSTPWALRSRS